MKLSADQIVNILTFHCLSFKIKNTEVPSKMSTCSVCWRQTLELGKRRMEHICL